MDANTPVEKLVESLRRDGQHGRALGLLACARLARFRVPLRGLMLANEPDGAMDRIGRRHFGLRGATRELREALNAVGSVEQRDAIETALGQVMVARDDSYYCLGLAVGLTAGESIVGHVRRRESRVKGRKGRRVGHRLTGAGQAARP